MGKELYSVKRSWSLCAISSLAAMNTEENDSLNSAGSGGALLNAGGNLVGAMSAERTVALCARMNEWYLSLDVSGQNADAGMLLLAVMSIHGSRRRGQR